MRTICSREIFTKKCRQQQNFDSDPKEAWHYNHVTFTSIAKNFMLYCRLIYMLSMLYVRLTIKVKVGIPESFKVGWHPHKITGSSHLKRRETTPCIGKATQFYKECLVIVVYAVCLNDSKSFVALHFQRCKSTLDSLKNVFSVFRRKSSLGAPVLFSPPKYALWPVEFVGLNVQETS